jgi:DNA-binding MarR family transcriptional regulator
VASSGVRAARRPPKPAETPRRAPLRGVASAAGGRSGQTRDLDELLHHRIRLGIVSALAGTEELSFVELRALLGVTDGNLSVHARKLEEAGYIRCTKSFAARRPRTAYRLAESGLRALQRYLDHMQAVIAATRTTLDR